MLADTPIIYYYISKNLKQTNKPNISRLREQTWCLRKNNPHLGGSKISHGRKDQRTKVN